jgi:hypothetical protein
MTHRRTCAVQAPDCIPSNLLKGSICDAGHRTQLAPGTREITFSDPSAASSAQSPSHCRVVRRLIRRYAVLLCLETSHSIGRKTKPKDASEMACLLVCFWNTGGQVSGKISEDSAEKYHM